MEIREPRGQFPIPGSSQLSLLVWLLQNVGGTILVALALSSVLYLSEHDNRLRLDKIEAEQVRLDDILKSHDTGIFKILIDGQNAARVNQDKIIGLLSDHQVSDVANETENRGYNQEEIRQLHDIVNLLVTVQRGPKSRYGEYIPVVPKHFELDALR